MSYYIGFKIFIYISLAFVALKDFSFEFVDMAQFVMFALLGITAVMIVIDLILNVVNL